MGCEKSTQPGSTRYPDGLAIMNTYSITGKPAGGKKPPRPTVRVPLSERADPDPACVRVPAPSSSESAPPRAARHITHQPSSPHAAISADVGRPCRSPPPSPKMGKGGSPSKYVDMGVAVAIPCFVCYSEFNRTRPAVCAHSDIGVVAECVHACAALCCARRES